MIGNLFGNISLLEKGLDASWLRNEVISNNLANSDTPNFITSSVEFESIFKDALENDDSFKGIKTNEKHIDIGASNLDEIDPMVIKNNSTSMRMDGNNIDIESEMTNLAKNSLYYNTLTQKISSELGRLRMAINEGK